MRLLLAALLVATACTQALDGDLFRAPEEDAAAPAAPVLDAGPDAGELDSDNPCGNGTCGPAEDACSCPADCQPTCGEKRCCGDDLCCVVEIGECAGDCTGPACFATCAEAREVCRDTCQGDDECKEACDDREVECRTECG